MRYFKTLVVAAEEKFTTLFNLQETKMKNTVSNPAYIQKQQNRS